MSSRSFIVVGTDTGVGKTVVSAGLLFSYIKAGVKAIVQKWVSTGDPFGFSEDVRFCLQLSGIDLDDYPLVNKRLINPYSFVYPASPHFASLKHRKIIRLKDIETAFYELNSLVDLLIVEGVGGVNVPLTEKVLLIDVIARLELPVVLVIKNMLGTINHSLLTIEALHNRGIKIIGLVFNDAYHYNVEVKKDNIRIIKKITRLAVLGQIPYMADIRDYKDVFDNIRREIDKRR